MSTVKTEHGRMSLVDENGDVTILHQETSASDVIINSTGEVIPSYINDVQKLADNIGALALKSSIDYSDLSEDMVANNFTATSSGKVLDARAGKELNDRLNILEESDILVIGIEEENKDIVIPESEINDDVTSESLTWSSKKIDNKISRMLDDYESTSNIYVQDDEPLDAEAGSLWVDMDAESDTNIDDITVDVVDDLTTTDSSKALSANQGVVLKGMIDNIDIPSNLSELSDDITHRLVTDTEKTTWNSKAEISDIPTKVSELNNDRNFITNSDIPVTSVNGKNGDIVLTASDLGINVSDASSAAISAHNSNVTSHTDIRELINGLNTRLNTLANSTDEDLDQLAEIVSYIKNNKDLIDSITTSKVNVSDVIDNLTTNNSTKPLSANQGVVLKALIDAITVPTKLSELSDDVTHRLVTDTEKTTWNSKANVSDIPTKVSELNNDKNYITSSDISVTSVNGKNGDIVLTATDVGADTLVTNHNDSNNAHNDIRNLINQLNNRIDNLGDIEGGSTTTQLIEIIDNLTTEDSGKALSANQGVILKKLVDAIVVPTKISELTNDKNYITSTTAPVTSINGKNGDVVISATDVGADTLVSTHNDSTDAHSDIRDLINGLSTRLNTLANSTDEDLDQMAEIVSYIKDNKSIIDSITTSKVNVSDIIDNLTTSNSTKPLSANQGVVLKALIDAITVPTKISELTNDSGFITGKETPVNLGVSNTTSGSYSTGIGSNNSATKIYSTAIGYKNTASGNGATALGYNNTVNGTYATAIGYYAEASGDNSTALSESKATGTNSFAATNGEASGQYSSALGYSSYAIGDYSTAICSANANGDYSFAQGYGSNAKGLQSTALGNFTLAEGDYQVALGRYNVGTAGPTSLTDTTGVLLVIGNGTADSDRKNLLSLYTDGNMWLNGKYNTPGGDYAEYFEWSDGNKDNEDRCGHFVTLDGEKIRYATPDDSYILGVVSAAPSIVGDSYDESWHGKYLKNIFGKYITETVKVAESVDKKTGKVIPAHTDVRFIINPEYNPEEEYIPRKDRPEWCSIGMMGKLVVIDDGTCEVNGYASVGENGIATKGDMGYRVLSRLDENHVKIIFR